MLAASLRWRTFDSKQQQVPNQRTHVVSITVFAESLSCCFITRARKEGIRDFGACMAPMTVFRLQGLETLPLRMAKHVSNALEAGFLEKQTWCYLFPIPASVIRLRACPANVAKGCGAVFSFELKGGEKPSGIY